jgi:small-conductance mechanosensitive channel
LYFWASNLGDNTRLIGDIISRITSQFKEAGIVIPIPQQELLIKSISNEQGQEPVLPKADDKK